MSEKKCRFCGGEIERISDGLICQNCGKRVEFVDDAISESKSFEVVKEKESKKIFMTVIACVLIVCLIVALRSCGIFDDGKGTILKILKQNGYTSQSYEIEKVVDLPDGVKGLPSGYKNKLVLINDEGYYGYATVNTEEKSVTVPVYGFVPLNVVQQKIWSMDKNTNIECFDIFKEYIERYGVNCMETKMRAEAYLRDLNKKDIISLDTAQNVISNSTMQIFHNIKSNDEVVVIFEKNTAVPTHYTTHSSMMTYNWDRIFPESVYKVWDASTDYQSKNTMKALYGQPYVLKNVWAVVDSNLKEVGTYNSLEEVKKIFQK